MTANNIYTTDWLNSSTVFYNTVTKKISYSITDVIDKNNFEFHPEGLHNYLEFGYSVFGQTPIKNVLFLDHSSSIQLVNKKLVIKKNDDVSLELHNGKVIDERDVCNLLFSKIQRWEAKQKENIIIPTSGGFDSRILNSAIRDKSKILSFTYGLSDIQSESYEVVYAKELARVLNTRWKQVELGDFHKYFDDWYSLFGASVHFHGMYQIEFYTKIAHLLRRSKLPILSGIIGDAWSDRNKISPISNYNELELIGYTHGLHADPTACLLKSNHAIKEKFYENNKIYIQDERLRTVLSMRVKMMLLKYLFKVPESLGFMPWSPFLDPEVALSILQIAPERRESTAWQREFFKKSGLLIEDQNLPINKFNTLYSYAIKMHPLKPLSTKLLREIIDQKYIEWINSELTSTSVGQRVTQYLLHKRVFNVILPYVGISNKQLTAYYAYLTLKPLEYLLESRNV